MVKAALAQLFPHLIHVICLAHALHRVCEYVRENYKEVDELIAYVNAIFAKSSLSIRGFREASGDIPLPPEPVLTRWATWLTADRNYNKYFIEVEKFLGALDPNEAAAIPEHKNFLVLPRFVCILLQLTQISAFYAI